MDENVDTYMLEGRSLSCNKLLQLFCGGPIRTNNNNKKKSKSQPKRLVFRNILLIGLEHHIGFW